MITARSKKRWTRRYWTCREDGGRKRSRKRLRLPANGLGRIFPRRRVLSGWNASLRSIGDGEMNAAVELGEMQARLQHASALEMIWQQRQGQIEAARAWRTIIKLPNTPVRLRERSRCSGWAGRLTAGRGEPVAGSRVCDLADHARAGKSRRAVPPCAGGPGYAAPCERKSRRGANAFRDSGFFAFPCNES